MSTAYIAGLVCGVLGVFLVCWIIINLNKKKGKAEKTYDERQQAIRDKGFRLAYLTLIGYLALFAFVHSLGVVWCEVGGGVLVGVLLSLLVHIIYSIYKDAYFKLNERPGFYVELFAAMGFGNVVLGLVRRLFGSVTGLLGYGDLNLLVGIFIVIAWVNILIKLALDKNAKME